jgi:hypothetical protein
MTLMVVIVLAAVSAGNLNMEQSHVVTSCALDSNALANQRWLHSAAEPLLTRWEVPQA